MAGLGLLWSISCSLWGSGAGRWEGGENNGGRGRLMLMSAGHHGAGGRVVTDAYT